MLVNGILVFLFTNKEHVAVQDSDHHGWNIILDSREPDFGVMVRWLMVFWFSYSLIMYIVHHAVQDSDNHSFQGSLNIAVIWS